MIGQDILKISSHLDNFEILTFSQSDVRFLIPAPWNVKYRIRPIDKKYRDFLFHFSRSSTNLKIIARHHGAMLCTAIKTVCT